MARVKDFFLADGPQDEAPQEQTKPDDLEMLAIDAQAAVRRYREERNKRKAENGSPRPSH